MASEMVDKKRHSPTIFERIIFHILKLSDEAIGQTTVNSLASAFNISTTDLHHIFKEEKFLAPTDYLTRMKMFRAASLLETLKSGKITAAKVGRMVGFDNDIIFRREFKKQWGIPPGKYLKCRKALKRKEADLKGNPPHAPVKTLSFLTKTGVFDLDFAYIIEDCNRYRLIVHDHREGILFDRKYKTVVNSRIGFLRYFGDKYTTESPVPEWSAFIAPETRWFNKQMQFVESYPHQKNTEELNVFKSNV